MAYPDGSFEFYTVDRVPCIGELVRTDSRSAARVEDVITDLIRGTITVMVR